MIPDDTREIKASYGRCSLSGGFDDTFYDLFFASSPVIRQMFQNTDMAKQKKALKMSIPYVVMFAEKSEAGRVKIDNLGVSHSRQGFDINPSLYRLWVDSLIGAVATHDEKFDAALESKWRAVVAPALERMASLY